MEETVTDRIEAIEYDVMRMEEKMCMKKFLEG